MDIIKLKLTGDTSDITEGVLEIAPLLNIELSDDGFLCEISKSADSYTVAGFDGNYRISYSFKTEFFKALAVLCYNIKNEKRNFTISENSDFDSVGIMVDVSSAYVMTVDACKDYIRRMSLMGLDMLMLYTEDVYKMDKYPYFGYMRGAYTEDELKEIVAYGEIFGVELVPCIQTLAHLSKTLRWPFASKIKENQYTLLPDCDETYEFIEEMFKTMRRCFKTNNINIGMDEAGNLGLGNHFKKFGYESSSDIMIRHIGKVVEIAEKYGFKPMMWSDMFFKNGTMGGDYDVTSVIPENTSERLPENIKMIYWDYSIEDANFTQTIINRHDEIGRDLVFAGGIWSWNRITPNFKKSFDTALKQLKICKQNGVRKVFATIWSAFINPLEMLPAMQMWSELRYRDDITKEELAEGFRISTSYDLNAFLNLSPDSFSDEILSEYANPRDTVFCVNSSIGHFFQDIMPGLLDKTIEGYDFKSHYQKLLNAVNALPHQGDMQWIFDKYKILYEFLVKKCDIGIRIYNAYHNNDIEKLMEFASEIDKLIELLDIYSGMTYEMWCKYYKIFGWNKIDMKFGSLMSRLKTAKCRISDYLSGTLDRLEELECERLYYNEITKPIFETGIIDDFMSV